MLASRASVGGVWASEASGGGVPASEANFPPEASRIVAEGDGLRVSTNIFGPFQYVFNNHYLFSKINRVISTFFLHFTDTFHSYF